MRILFVIGGGFFPSTFYGGPVDAVFDLATGLSMSGWHVDILTTDADGPGRRVAVPTEKWMTVTPRVRVWYSKHHLSHTFAPSFLPELWRSVTQADLVHLSGVYSMPAMPVLFTCRVQNVPLAWAPHGSLHPWGSTLKLALKTTWRGVCSALAPFSTTLLAASERELDACRTLFPSLSSVCIPGAIRIPKILGPKAQSDVLRLISFGRLHPVKGLERLLAACAALLSAAAFPWTLEIAGQGEASYCAYLESLVRQFRLCDHVRFKGHLQGLEKAEFLRGASVAVFPSYTENFCISVAEALSYGTPVIVSDNTPWQDVDRMECGFCVSNSVPSIVNAIQRIATADLLQMGANGRLWVTREFSLESRLAQYLRVFESVSTRAASNSSAVNL